MQYLTQIIIIITLQSQFCPEVGILDFLSKIKEITSPASGSVSGLGTFILIGYRALLLGVQRRRSSCHSSALSRANTLLSSSHCRCAVLYRTALLSPCIENLPNSKQANGLFRNLIIKLSFYIIEICMCVTVVSVFFPLFILSSYNEIALVKQAAN